MKLSVDICYVRYRVRVTKTKDVRSINSFSIFFVILPVDNSGVLCHFCRLFSSMFNPDAMKRNTFCTLAYALI